MNDTPKHILKKQFEIINSIPLREKLLNLFELTELSRTIIENRIKEKHPDISEIDLKIELFRCFYKYDFDEAKMNKIIYSMREYYYRNKSEALLHRTK